MYNFQNIQVKPLVQTDKDKGVIEFNLDSENGRALFNRMKLFIDFISKFYK